MKIKEAFEKSGNIENMFYKRACAIAKTGVDPMDSLLKSQKILDKL